MYLNNYLLVTIANLMTVLCAEWVFMLFSKTGRFDLVSGISSTKTGVSAVVIESLLLGPTSVKFVNSGEPCSTIIQLMEAWIKWQPQKLHVL